METVKQPAHYLMAPSSASRWLKCPGSLRVPHPPDTGTKEAAELGTLAHAMTEARLRLAPLADKYQRHFDSLSAYLQADYQNAIDACVDFVNGLPHKTKEYETQIASDWVEEHGGTVDVIAVDKTEIHVVDFKFGRTVVEIEDNDQVRCYLNLARQKYPGRKRFIGTIIQPFQAGVSTCEFSVAELDAHAQAVMQASVSDHFAAGDHCRYCPLLPTCQTAADYVHSEIKDFPNLTKLVAEIGDRPSDEDVEKLARVYKTYKIAAAGCEGAGDILKRWAKKGVDIAAQGLGLRLTYRSDWNESAPNALRAAGIADEDWKVEAVLSPTKVRERLGMSKEAFEADFKSALDVKEISALIIGKGSRKTYPEFDG